MSLYLELEILGWLANKTKSDEIEKYKSELNPRLF